MDSLLKKPSAKTPAGWWAIENASGLRTEIIARLKAETGMPPEDRDFLVAKLEQRTDTAIYLDAAVFLKGGDWVIHAHIQTNF